MREAIVKRTEVEEQGATQQARSASEGKVPSLALRACCVLPPLLRLDVVDVEQILIADVQLAVGDDRVRPGVLAGLLRLVEAAALDVFLGVGVDQDDRAALVAVVEAAVGVEDRSLTRLALRPHDLAGLELHA